MEEREQFRRRDIWLTVLSGWLVLVALHTVILHLQEDLPIAWSLSGAIIHYGSMACLAWPVWTFCSWIGKRQRPWWLVLLLHGAVGVVAVVGWAGIELGLTYLVAGPIAVRMQLGNAGLWLLLQVVLTYLLLVGAVVVVQAMSRLAKQREREAELRLLAREAEVRALRAQLRPHFLFNVFNSVYALIGTEPRKAEKMIDQLATLMRETLEVSDQASVPLEKELALVERYLEIEAVRLGERLSVDVEVEPEVADLTVPPLLLQPVVENAIKHGVAASDRPGRVQVAARGCRLDPSDAASSAGLELTVADTGPGQDGRTTQPEGTGRGLAITRARLENLYGDRCSVDVRDNVDAGWTVSLRIPAVPA